MWKTKLCLGLSRTYGLPEAEQVRVMRKTGFEGFFSDWQRGCDVALLRKTADEEGMIYQSIHAPFGRIDRMWEPNEETEDVIQEQIECLRDCAENNVPIMVAHTFIGFTKHNPTQAGLDHFGIVVREAEKLGVKVALENTEGEEYLAALMQHFKGNASVGFCWDTGHEMCYNHSQDMLALYGDRLIATHINDNLGIRDFNGAITFYDDLHLLPFDGVGDWDGIADRLNHWGFGEILTFELNNVGRNVRHENDVYSRMSPEEYIAHAYIRACRFATLKERRKNSK